MTYKNGIKEFLIMAVCYGVPMGVFFGLSNQSLLIGIVTGLLAGLLFALAMFAVAKIQEKKFDKKRVEIASERKIICDGAATIKGNGGWMFLTENGIEFYPHKMNFSTKEVIIPMNTIEAVMAQKNQIVVITADKSTVAVVVTHNIEWKKQIDAALSKR